MFQYQYPQFQFKALLREEMLDQLRDYPKTYLQLSFTGYGDGIVSGCGITWDNGKLAIAPGIVYRSGNLYFMKEPYIMDCEADNKKRHLKIRFLTEVNEPRRVVGNTRIVLEHEAADMSCEIELCRFCLQDGAKLRDKYENFEDFATEYDTINLIHSPFASEGRATLPPRILKQFARETFANKTADPYDVSFSMNILANQGVLSAECILEYLAVRLDGTVRDESGPGMYRGLSKILREQEHGGGQRRETNQGRKGVMLL